MRGTFMYNDITIRHAICNIFRQIFCPKYYIRKKKANLPTEFKLLVLESLSFRWWAKTKLILLAGLGFAYSNILIHHREITIPRKQITRNNFQD